MAERFPADTASKFHLDPRRAARTGRKSGDFFYPAALGQNAQIETKAVHRRLEWFILEKETGTVYQQIAVDIASKIVAGNYEVGDKLYARSSLATRYNVSSETARRALCILADVGIVDIVRGSGVVVSSRENAIQFVRQFSDSHTMSELKADIFQALDAQQEAIAGLKGLLQEYADRADRFHETNPFVPYEIVIQRDCPLLGKTLMETNFWQNTGATIVAFKHQGEIFMSPGPYSAFQEGDVVYYVGDDNTPDQVKRFLYPEPRSLPDCVSPSSPNPPDSVPSTEVQSDGNPDRSFP